MRNAFSVPTTWHTTEHVLPIFCRFRYLQKPPRALSPVQAEKQRLFEALRSGGEFRSMHGWTGAAADAVALFIAGSPSRLAWDRAALGPATQLVPVPPSTMRAGGTATRPWPSMLLAHALSKRGLGGTLVLAIARTKSAGDATSTLHGQRLCIQQHLASLVVSVDNIDPALPVVLVDDSIQSGANAMACSVALTAVGSTPALLIAGAWQRELEGDVMCHGGFAGEARWIENQNGYPNVMFPTICPLGLK